MIPTEDFDSLKGTPSSAPLQAVVALRLPPSEGHKFPAVAGLRQYRWEPIATVNAPGLTPRGSTGRGIEGMARGCLRRVCCVKQNAFRFTQGRA